MRVVATATGYYGGVVRNAGDAFSIQSEKDFSNVWMTAVRPAVSDSETIAAPSSEGKRKYTRRNSIRDDGPGDAEDELGDSVEA